MNETGNATNSELFSSTERYITGVLYSICAIMISVSNAFTLYILQTCHNAFQENTRLFLKALAIVDLCGGLFGVTLDFNLLFTTTSSSAISGHVCTLLPSLYYSNFNQTLALLCCINLDRLLTIVWPLRYPILVTPKRAKCALFFALLIPVLFTVFLWPIPGFPITELVRGFCGLNDKDGQRSGWVDATMIGSDISITTTLSLMILPFALTTMITTICNVCLIFISCRHIRKMNLRIAGQQRVNKQRNGQDILKGVRTVLVITVLCYAGIGTWGFIILYITPRLRIPVYKVPFIIACVVELSTRWWNCIIYLSTSQTFREHATKAIKRMCRRKNNQLII